METFAPAYFDYMASAVSGNVCRLFTCLQEMGCLILRLAPNVAG